MVQFPPSKVGQQAGGRARPGAARRSPAQPPRLFGPAHILQARADPARPSPALSGPATAPLDGGVGVVAGMAGEGGGRGAEWRPNTFPADAMLARCVQPRGPGPPQGPPPGRLSQPQQPTEPTLSFAELVGWATARRARQAGRGRGGRGATQFRPSALLTRWPGERAARHGPTPTPVASAPLEQWGLSRPARGGGEAGPYCTLPLHRPSGSQGYIPRTFGALGGWAWARGMGGCLRRGGMVPGAWLPPRPPCCVTEGRAKEANPSADPIGRHQGAA